MFHLQSRWSPETRLLSVRSAWETSARKLRWEIVWRNAPRIWRDLGSALSFKTRLTQTKLLLPLSNEYGSQVKDKGRWQCWHSKQKISLSSYTLCIFTFRTRLVICRVMENILCQCTEIEECRKLFHVCRSCNYVWCRSVWRFIQ
jgi:hypothetical protein